MHRFIPSRPQLSYPSHCPCYTESYGEVVVLKQLVFSSWKANPTEGNLSLFHKAHNKCVSTLKRARKQRMANLKNELSKLSPCSKTWWSIVQSISGVCSPSIPSLSSNDTTADCVSQKAKCLNSVFVSKYCIPNTSLSVPTLCSYT